MEGLRRRGVNQIGRAIGENHERPASSNLTPVTSPVLRSAAEFLSQLAAGSTISHLYQKDFVSFSYRAPACRDDQTAIATVLSDMDAELAALEAQIGRAHV